MAEKLNLFAPKGGVLRVQEGKKSEFLTAIYEAFHAAGLRESRDYTLQEVCVASGAAHTGSQAFYQLTFDKDARASVSAVGMIYDVMDTYHDESLLNSAHAEVERRENLTTMRKRREPLNEALQARTRVPAEDAQGYIDDLQQGYQRNGFVEGKDYFVTTKDIPKLHPELIDHVELTISFSKDAKERQGPKVHHCLNVIRKLNEIDGRSA